MITAEKSQLLELYNAALNLYKQRNFQAAKEQFQQCLQIIPEDGPAKLYLDRCDTYITHPPGDDWDGVFVMTTK
ncbi:MAG: tetratricopeptide repeat protein [Leptospiraceae bacterium]|nr:tetratricopeptide repeat protein [Leptospiraceae bacterium]